MSNVHGTDKAVIPNLKPVTRVKREDLKPMPVMPKSVSHHQRIV